VGGAEAAFDADVLAPAPGSLVVSARCLDGKATSVAAQRAFVDALATVGERVRRRYA
jgi:hypothetical protein